MGQNKAGDPLSGLAPLLRVRPELQDFCRFGGAWEAPHQAAEGGVAYFHIVTRGECLLERRGHEPLRLKAGDILLLPHGDAHVTRGRIQARANHASRPICVSVRTHRTRLMTRYTITPIVQLCNIRAHPLGACS